MASAGSIFVDLLLRDANYVQGLNRARGNTRRFSGQVSGDVGKVQSAFAGVLSPVNNATMAIGQLGGVLAGALSIQRIVQYSDTWRQLEGRLNIVAGSMGDVGTQQEQLFEIAQRTRQPLEGIFSFYSRLAQFIPEAERAQYDLLGVTESVATALAITGETSESSTAAMIQFTQAIGTNFEAAGQELRSLQEQAPRLTQALMKALGDGTKSLQQLKEEGKLTRESVLNALSGTGEEAQRLAEELEKVPLTVGQAFTRLDNAFLSFIGTSSEVNSATSALALGVDVLAQNLDAAAKSVLAISAFLSVRFVAGLIDSRKASVLAAIDQVKYTAAINSTTAALGANTAAATRWASAIAAQNAAAAGSVSGTVIAVNRAGQAAVLSAGALSTFAVAARTAGAALLAAFGGPVGATILTVGYAIFELTKNTDEAAKVTSRYNSLALELYSITDRLGTASGKRADALRDERDQLLAKAQAEIKDTEALLRKYDVLQTFSGGVFGIGLNLMARKKEEGLRESLDAQYRELDILNQEINRNIINGEGGRPSYTPSSGGGDSKAEKKRIDELTKSYERYEYLIKGISKEQLKYSQAEAELGELYKANKISLDEYFGALEALDTEFDENSKTVNEWGMDLEAISKRAAENMQDAFADFLFDPFEDGLDGMLDSFLKVIQRMAAEELSAIVFGAKDMPATGGGGSFLGDLFDGFFATGGFIQPGHFGIAGEAGAEIVMGGKSGATVIPMGGGGVTVNVINNTPANVTTQERQGANGMELMVMIDEAVARNVGTPGSKTNQALGAFAGRTMVRR